MKSEKIPTRAGCACLQLTMAQTSFWTQVIHLSELYGRISVRYALLCILLSLAQVVPAIGQTPYFQEVRSIYNSRTGISMPIGLTYVDGARTMLVVPRANSTQNGSGTSLAMISIMGDPVGNVTLPFVIQNPLDVAFSELEGALYVLDPATRILFKVPISTAGQTVLETSLIEVTDLSSIPLQNPTGITFDPDTGTLYILDGGQQEIFSIAPKSQRNLGGADALKEGRLHTISVKGTGLVNPRGIAFDPQNKSLYI